MGPARESELDWTKFATDPAPMKRINIHQAKAQLSRLVEKAANGDEIVITRSGKPIAKLVSISPTPQPKVKGLLKGKIKIKESFFEPLPEATLDEFERKSHA